MAQQQRPDEAKPIDPQGTTTDREDLLDDALDDTFPASDPPSMTVPKPKVGAPSRNQGSTSDPAPLSSPHPDENTGAAERDERVHHPDGVPPGHSRQGG